MKPFAVFFQIFPIPCKLEKPLRRVLLTALVTLAACMPNQQPKVAGHTSTAVLRGAGSLAVDVVEYSWVFFNYGHHLRLTGRVRNNSPEAQQAVSLKLILRDETGAIVLQGPANVYPGYLRPGGEGSFEITALVSSPGRNLPAGYLETTALTSGSQ